MEQTKNGIDKFGENRDMDTGGAEDVWSQGGIYTFLTVKALLYISSTEAADDQVVEVQGLDLNGLLMTQRATLNGQTQVVLSGEWLRVFRAKIVDSSAPTGDVYVAQDAAAAITAGVPDDATKIKAKIDIDANQTLMAIYTVPQNKQGAVVSYYFGIRPNNTVAGWAEFALYIRPQGGVFQMKFTGGVITTGQNIMERMPLVVTSVNPMDDIKITCLACSANNMKIVGGFGIKWDI